MTLEGRHAVVTGCVRGIGRAIAAALCAAEATGTVVGRNAVALEETVDEGDARHYVVADVTDSQALGEGLKRAAAEHGTIDILVANAGGAESAPFTKTEPDLFRKMFELNVMGTVHAMQAVMGLVRALAAETATSGVTVNAICPGYTDTELVRDSVARLVQRTGRSREKILAEMLKDNPLGRLVRPEEVAAAVLFLCSPEAGAITGTTLTVAGGEA